ncbi:MAG: chorismate synthase [Myxococcota bacterium]|jgi:chorismate synthase|nr:chorismate synthase [Myxococcota bacterium]
MSGNSFGTLLRITTFGESHGPGLGVVVDGLPAGLLLDTARLQAELDRRRPGGPLTSPRREPDRPELLSGLLDGRTTGAPLTLLIRNQDARPADYGVVADLLRPGHAAYSWEHRFGVFDARGGGRASGRETAARVLAGAVARQVLAELLPALQVRAFVDGVGLVQLPPLPDAELDARLAAWHPDGYPTPLSCPDEATATAMVEHLQTVAAAGDSLGGTVRCRVHGLPAGLGNPLFDKLPALLGHGLLSVGGVRGIEFGLGFAAARLRGSAHNDPFVAGPDGRPVPGSNRAGGLLGGVSTGQPLDFRVAVKPTSSLGLPQPTVDRAGQPATLRLGGRHDPCIALRLPPVVEAVTCLVLLDCVLVFRAERGQLPGARPA